eukprot:gene2567-biopygen14098
MQRRRRCQELCEPTTEGAPGDQEKSSRPGGDPGDRDMAIQDITFSWCKISGCIFCLWEVCLRHQNELGSTSLPLESTSLLLGPTSLLGSTSPLLDRTLGPAWGPLGPAWGLHLVWFHAERGTAPRRVAPCPPPPPPRRAALPPPRGVAPPPPPPRGGPPPPRRRGARPPLCASQTRRLPTAAPPRAPSPGGGAGPGGNGGDRWDYYFWAAGKGVTAGTTTFWDPARKSLGLAWAPAQCAPCRFRVLRDLLRMQGN